MDLNAVKKHWDDPETVSLKDENLRDLERGYLLEFLKTKGKVGMLGDIGCGDGGDTKYWQEFADKVTAYDYSQTMVTKAGKNLGDKADLFQFDLLEDDFDRKFDTVITKRCLINLGDFENQKGAIRKIHKAINDEGYYLMLECCQEGLNNLNEMRTSVGLEQGKQPFHNAYFDLAELTGFLGEYFHIEQVRYFSTYYFLTRVYNQILDQERFKEFDLTAKKLHMQLDLFGQKIIGPQFLMALKKKEHNV